MGKATARISNLVGRPRPDPLHVAASLSSTASHLARTCAVLQQLGLLHKLRQADQDYMRQLATAVGYDVNNPGERGREGTEKMLLVTQPAAPSCSA